MTLSKHDYPTQNISLDEKIFCVLLDDLCRKKKCGRIGCDDCHTELRLTALPKADCPEKQLYKPEVEKVIRGLFNAKRNIPE